MSDAATITKRAAYILRETVKSEDGRACMTALIAAVMSANIHLGEQLQGDSRMVLLFKNAANILDPQCDNCTPQETERGQP